MYVRIWQYEVRREAVDRFIATYGARGDWARLFAARDGFAGTELFRSADGRNRFITIDRWRDESDWTAFLQQRQESYEALDRRLAELTAVDLPLFEGTIPAPAAASGRAGDGNASDDNPRQVS